MGEFPSKEHWQNCCETVREDSLEIDAILGDIIIFMSLLLLITFHLQ